MKKGNKNVRKLTKTGRGSMYVILPKEFIASFGWKERQKLVVTRGQRCLIIKDWKNR